MINTFTSKERIAPCSSSFTVFYGDLFDVYEFIGTRCTFRQQFFTVATQGIQVPIGILDKTVAKKASKLYSN